MLSRLSSGNVVKSSEKVVEIAVLRKPSQLQKAKKTRLKGGRFA